MSEKIQWVSCISGSGTTATEMIKAIQRGEVPRLEFAGIICSDPQAKGIQRILDLGIPLEKIVVVNPYQEKFGQEILRALHLLNADIVTLNGWMPLMPRNVVESYSKCIFNQHPGPVPEFGGKGMYGRRVHETVIQFSRLTGRTDLYTEVVAQRVDVDYDAGEVVEFRRVDFTPDDDGDSLQQKALPIEHQVQIDLLKDISNNSFPKVHRSFNLVSPDQMKYLIQAKKIAFKKYPHG